MEGNAIIYTEEKFLFYDLNTFCSIRPETDVLCVVMQHDETEYFEHFNQHIIQTRSNILCMYILVSQVFCFVYVRSKIDNKVV